MRNETKVGFVVIAGFLVLMGIVTFLGAFSIFSPSTYDLTVNFKRAGGLKPGSIVHYVGVPVGKIEDIVVDGNSVKVRVSIKKEVKIPEGSSFLLGSAGIMGSSYIDIEPPAPDMLTGNYVPHNAEVHGYAGNSLGDFMDSASHVLVKLEAMADSFNSILSDKDVQDSIKGTMINVKDITTNVNELTRVFANIAVQNQDELSGMVRQLNGMATHMNQVATRMDNMLVNIDNNGQASADIVKTLNNLREASENVEKITKSIEELTGDPKVKADIKDTLQNTREASAKANKLLGGFGGIKTETSLDFKYGDKPDKYRVDANLKINYRPNKFITMGVADIGEENDINLQLGREYNKYALRGGLILGDVGAGIDLMPSKRFKLSADVYDPNKVKIRLAGEIRLNDKFSIVGESLDVRKKASDKTYVGVRGYF